MEAKHAEPTPVAPPAGCGWRIQDAEKTGWPYELAQEICEWAKKEIYGFHRIDIELGHIPVTKLVVEFLEKHGIQYQHADPPAAQPTEHDWQPRTSAMYGVRCSRCFQIANAPHQNDKCEAGTTTAAQAGEYTLPDRPGRWMRDEGKWDVLVEWTDSETIFAGYRDGKTPITCRGAELASVVPRGHWRPVADAEVVRRELEEARKQIHEMQNRLDYKPGGCKILSLGDNCYCTLCQQSRHLAASQADNARLTAELATLKEQKGEVIVGPQRLPEGMYWAEFGWCTPGWVWNHFATAGKFIEAGRIAFRLPNRLPSPAPEGKAEPAQQEAAKRLEELEEFRKYLAVSQHKPATKQDVMVAMNVIIAEREARG